MYSSREAVIPLSLPVPFLSCAERTGYGKSETPDLPGFLCLQPAGANLFPIRASAFLCSSSTQVASVLYAHTGMCVGQVSIQITS